MATDNYTVRILTDDNRDILQGLCDRCSDYYAVCGGTRPDGKASGILTDLPPGKSRDDKYVFGIFDKGSELRGVIDLVRDYPQKGEWIIGLLMLDPQIRGKGCGGRAHGFVKALADGAGAERLRIGVFGRNERALKFWKRLGYTETGRRDSEFGGIIIMNLSLKGGGN